MLSLRSGKRKEIEKIKRKLGQAIKLIFEHVNA
jgi:hypothetical protein